MSTCTTVRVDTSSRSYDVVVGAGILDDLGSLICEARPTTSAFVVSDSNVAPLYLDRALASIAHAGIDATAFQVPAGEQFKTLATFGTILEAMAEAELTRDSIVVALGGGVVGDMAGFAAACYMRGIEVVQVPTTLLSMVDSSVGGKTAVDLASGKNLVGAFLQPSLVVADVECLRTLDQEVFCDGMGEVVKHGVLADEDLFEDLLAHPVLIDSDAAYLVEIVARNMSIKRDVVNADERERGLRQTLNLGHTIGHAIEAASNYELGHGHCVAAGLCCVARGAERLGWADSGLSTKIEACVKAQGLPTDTSVDHQTLLQFAGHDKKRHGNTVNLVVPQRIGQAALRTVTFEQLSDVIQFGCGVS